jgi:putative ABC transport system permease protein
MRWSSIVRLYPSRLRARIGQEAFAFLGIVAGVALLFAVQVSNSSLNSSITRLTAGLLGRAQLEVVGREANSLPEALVAAVERDPNVQSVAPLVEGAGALDGPNGERAVTVLASDKRVAQLGGSLVPSIAVAVLPRLNAVILPKAVADAVGARSGSRTAILIAGRRFDVPVAAVIGDTSAEALAQAPVVLAPLALGQALTGASDRVSRILVVARPGRVALARRSLSRLIRGRADVRGAGFDSRVFAQADEPNAQSTSLFSQVTALVGFLFALNGMLMMARGRRDFWAQLRTDGISVSTLARFLILDAVALAIAASSAGLLLGDQVSRHFLPPAPGYLSIGFPVGSARTVPFETVVLAVGAGLAATLLGSFASLALHASRGHDSRASGTARRVRVPITRFLLLVGVVGTAATVVLLFTAPSSGRVAIALLVASMLLCLPFAFSGALGVAGRIADATEGVATSIAGGALRASPARSTVLAGIAAVAVCASGAIEGARQDLQAGLDGAVRGVTDTTQLWISPSSPLNQLGVLPFDPSARHVVEAVPHVHDVDVFRGALLTVGMRRVWVFGPPTSSRVLVPPSQVVVGDAALANRRVRFGRWAAVSAAIAAERRIGVGDRFRLPSPRPRVFRVAAIITNLGWPPGAIILSANSFRDAWTSNSAGALQVRFDGTISAAEGRRLVAHALARGPWSGLTAETVAERERHQQQSARDGLARLRAIGRLVLIASALALAIAVGAMILQRRPALAMLRLNGISARRVYSALLIEATIIVNVGCATGAVVAVLGVRVLDAWLTALTGFPVVRSLGVPAIATSYLMVGAVALAIVALPGFLAAQVDVEAAFDD